MPWPLVVAGVLLLVAILYWQLIVAEGAYLGRRVVALLYNLSAGAYDRIKQYNPAYEQWFLGQPLARALTLLSDPLVLDVATGTGRLPRTLFAQAEFRGRIVGLDYARRMLEEAARYTEPWQERLLLVRQGASTLPFFDDTFEAVSCLEALEFVPHPEVVVGELVRVLRPGGILLVTNRISKDAWMLPGRAYNPEDFEALLREQALEMVQTQTWQEDYDLVWARKAGAMGGLTSHSFAEALRCPACGGALRFGDEGVHCVECEARYPLTGQGILDLT